MSEINVGAISEALNNKVDLPTPTVPQDAVDYVIEMQRPTSANNYTWYRKYKSGWVEQGGQHTGSLTVTLPVEMANSDYQIITNTLYNNTGAALYNAIGYIATKTTESFTKGGTANNFEWQVCGMAAQ